MNKSTTFLIGILLLFTGQVWAQEKLLYSTEFNNASANSQSNWATVPASTTEQPVTKTTDFSNESLTFKFLQVAVNPSGTDSKFKYAPATADAGGVLVTAGWARAEKVAGSYIELSPLNSITKVVFTHGATGSSRGYKLWKKSNADADWVAVSSSFANPSSGTQVTVNINETNVALKFTNLDNTQNAYLFDLKIYGNYTSTVTQYPLTTSLNDNAAGTISRNPNATDYDAGTDVSLTATANFGYRFVKWVDAANGDADLSTTNPYLVTMNGAKNIKAVFAAKTTYNFTVTKEGSQWGEVLLTPASTGGKYEAGTEVTVQIVSNPVTTFSKWEDNSTVSQRVITVNNDVALTATFDEIPFIVGWSFKTDNVKQSKPADYYAESSNVGSISVHENTGAKVNWLYNTSQLGGTPNIRLWTSTLTATPRYLQAQFATTGYKNIQLKSQVSATTHAYSVLTLQYSLDGTAFNELARVDITNFFGTSWTNLNVTLPADAENKSVVYLRWIADTNSTELGSGNDGSAFTNIYVYADKEVVNDTEAPLLVTTIPANGSNTATIKGNIVLTFNERVKAGLGNITLGTTTLTGIFGAKTVTFPYEKLSYNTTYTVTVPTGALTDMSGNAYAGTTFIFTTANRAEPTKKLYDAVVAQDGSGDYISVMDAIAAAPTGRTAPWIIFIKNGTYTGHHTIPATKPFIHLIGQSRDGVIIADSRTSPTYGMRDRATFWVGAANCYFENIVIENTAGYQQGSAVAQADALSSEADKFAMKNVYLRSFQDTYQTTASSTVTTDRHYVVNSRIEGGTDFIYGGGNVYFDNDTLTVVRTGTVIVAPSHSSTTPWGYVFKDCMVNEAKQFNTTSYFGRPWQNAPRAVFINTKLYTNIYPEGWTNMSTIPAVFADYGTVNSSGNLVDVSQRKSSYSYTDNGNTVTGTAQSSLTDPEAATYTYENVILRNGDDWDPRLIAEAPDQPANVAVNSSFKLTWDAVSYTRLYVITRNNVVIGFSLTNEYTDATAVAGTNYTYKVQAANEYGALSIASSVVQVLPITGLTFNAQKVGNTAALIWSTITEQNTAHFNIERSRDGKIFETLGKRDAAGQSSTLKNYQYTDTNPLNGYNYYKIKVFDKDGQFSESAILPLKFDLQSTGLILFPNPTVNREFNITLFLAKAEQVTVKIVSLDGRVLQNETVSWAQGKTTKTIALNQSIPAGIYLININSPGLNEHLKLLVK